MLSLENAIMKTRLALLKAGDFDEEKHPRAEDGKWTDGGGSSSNATPAEGPKSDQAQLDNSWDSPNREQLARTQKIYTHLTDGQASLYIDRQMRGGVLKDGKFKAFSEGQKQENLRNIRNQMELLRVRDPEAFEAARQWSLAEEFGVEKYSDIPDFVTVYRGHDEGEKNWSVLNVTSKREVADKFGAAGIVTSYSINKKDISFTLHGSAFNEGELLVFNSKSMKKSEVKISSAVARQRKLAAIKVGSKVTTTDGPGVLLAHGVAGSAIVRLASGNTSYGAYITSI